MTTFKNDRGFASESKVCNEGCNEQSNEVMVTAEHYFSYVRPLLTKNFRKPITDHQ